MDCRTELTIQFGNWPLPNGKRQTADSLDSVCRIVKSQALPD